MSRSSLALLEEKHVFLLCNTVSTGTQRKYLSAQATFVLWLQENGLRSLLTCDSAHLRKKVDIRQQLLSPTCPIHLSRLTSKHIELFLISRHPNHETARAAVLHLFRTHHVHLPKGLEDNLTQLFKGLKREAVSQLHPKAKDSFDFAFYRTLAAHLQRTGKAEDLFLHLYLLMTWNAMCRTSNTAAIRFQDLEVVDDALVLRFPTMKNDQLAQCAHHPKHFYPNPPHPEICVILSLGIFLTCCYSNGKLPTRLFAGGNQQARYVCFFFLLSYTCVHLCFWL